MKTAGFDLGTNSIGICVRNDEQSHNITEQLDFFSTLIFPSGVGNGKSGEFSFAAQRTQKRSARNLYKARKCRIWGTLALLIEHKMCPLTIDELDQWRRYDKKKGLKRQYPITAQKFEQWVRCDFDGDGISEYTPYQLRKELMEIKYNFENETDRFKLGRALYHIAQRRGFKSSKGETKVEQEKKENKHNVESEEENISLKESEEKKSKALTEYMAAHNCPTIGCAFSLMEKEGIRIRGSEYHAVRSQYRDEIITIFKYQGLEQSNPDFCRCILSTKKDEGTIFYKRPLRSQKGLVGKCTLEPQKARCPICHPDFEEFRALTFINNIKYRKSDKDIWQTLNEEQRHSLYRSKFMRTKTVFKFIEIREWLEKNIGYPLSYKEKNINYKDNTSISACPISARFRNLFGEDWKEICIHTEAEKRNSKNGITHRVSYTMEDIWHVCFACDDEEFLYNFAIEKLGLDKERSQEFIRIYEAMQQGYASLSKKAINNILPFLRQGYIYSHAVLLAKIPEIIGKERWLHIKDELIGQLNQLQHDISQQKLIFNITNSLIANYKSLEMDERWGVHDYNYQLDESDHKDIVETCVNAIGKKSWEELDAEHRDTIIQDVTEKYQAFYRSTQRDYYKIPKMQDAMKAYLLEQFNDLDSKSLEKLYHPSAIEFYPASETGELGSPVIGAFKNPMAMRVLHCLRKQVNNLLKKGIINNETRIVIETARQLNDANTRWAMETYNKEREKENEAIKKILNEVFSERNISETDIEKVRYLLEQHDILEDGATYQPPKKKGEKGEKYVKDVTKYQLWLEQGCRCIYTGKIISISALFDDNQFEIEHTIPRSLSFDNSQANLTVCERHFNRFVKQNRLPSQLDNYNEILRRIQPWIDKVESIKDQIEYWKGASKSTSDVDGKNYCIRQRRLWEMEFNYWHNKVERFKMKDATTGFRNNQLVDTSIISKYAYHYLKTVFDHVEVQKGSVTADFRKMLGVQSVDEKKDRSKHSHHAIDASILTLIPKSNVRDKMLQLFYEIQEDKRLQKDTQWKQKELDKAIRRCNLHNISALPAFIEQNVLVNHIIKDQALTPAKRKIRRRGKVVLFNGKIRWQQGDCIRGQLHDETYYGAIRHYQFDDNNKLIRNEQGEPCIGNIEYVVRKPLKFKQNDNDSGFKKWDEIEKVIVDKDLIKMMKSQFEPETSFKDAYEQGIYMLNSKGEKINKIRHIRCFNTGSKPIDIKRHTYLSTKEHKQYYYATNGENLYYAIYWDGISPNRGYDYISLLDLAQRTVKEKRADLLFQPYKMIGKGKKTTEVPLYAMLQAGTRVIMFRPEEFDSTQILHINEYKQIISQLDHSNLMNRLYIMTRIFDPKQGLLQFKHHLEARNDQELSSDFPKEIYGARGKNGFSSFSYASEQPKLLLSPINFYFLIENKDFKIENAHIVFV